MHQELLNQLLEANFIPFDIETLSSKDLMDKSIFDYLITVEDKFEREKIIVQLQERAKKLECLSSFKKLLKEFNKKIENDNKQITQKEKLKHNQVAEKLLKENSIKIYENTVYLYDDGVYIDDQQSIERKIVEIVPDSDSHFRNEVYKTLLLTAEKVTFNKENCIINFKNGLYDVDKKSFYEHTPDFFSVNQVNINFNENVKNIQAVDNALDRLCTNNKARKQTILEMIGYCMTTSVKLQKAFILYGETARNGKSTLVKIITKLIGRKNIGNVSLRDISKNRFAISGIKNKLLNIGSEMTEDYLEDVSTFKMFVTGDDLEIEEKFKPKETISPYAKFIFNANTLPNVADNTNGFYRRLQIIPLETSFTDKDIKEFNLNELLTENALEYLAKISLDSYLAMDNQFSNYEESEKEINKYKISSNSILAFANDKEVLYSLCRNTKNVPAQTVYDEYKTYCINNKYTFVGRNNFYAEFEKYKVVTSFISNHQKYYIFT